MVLASDHRQRRDLGVDLHRRLQNRTLQGRRRDARGRHRRRGLLDRERNQTHRQERQRHSGERRLEHTLPLGNDRRGDRRGRIHARRRLGLPHADVRGAEDIVRHPDIHRRARRLDQTQDQVHGRGFAGRRRPGRHIHGLQRLGFDRHLDLDHNRLDGRLGRRRQHSGHGTLAGQHRPQAALLHLRLGRDTGSRLQRVDG